MTALLSRWNPVYSNSDNDFFLIAGICFAICMLLVRLFSSGRSKKRVTVSIVVLGETYAFDGIVDSGSFVRDPISSMPAIIVAAPALTKIHEVLRDERAESACVIRLRMIPAKTLGGERLLFGFVPDEIRIDGIKTQAVVAIDEKGKHYGGCSSIVPAVLSR